MDNFVAKTHITECYYPGTQQQALI